MDQLGPLLIAGRGEIAVRIGRTARRLGLSTVAVFTDEDAGAPHVDAADVAVPINSYLSIDELLRAARIAAAGSVHPGYGFLSENPGFARAVASAGLRWVGPPAGAIELMGDKARAKGAAADAGVPVLEDATEGPYPVVVKALAGGGGKGMRVVRSPEDLADATAAAGREALAAFGDGRVMVERYLERARHVEIQVLADDHGAVVHLGERECSLQRRYQKVIEETPSPAVGAGLRAQLGAAAVALASACGYRGAGTVEFVTSSDGDEFYFLEMNTRLQVEHAVTELVYGMDLVEQQLRIAAGERLGFGQDGLVPDGHAVEARVYAEDPAVGLLPAAGTVLAYGEPQGSGIRVDSGIRAGTEVSIAYDPLLAKVIAHGPDRATAIRRLDRALARFDLLGVPNNLSLTRALLAREDVRAGKVDTGLIERILPDLGMQAPGDLLAAAALAAAGTAYPGGPWRRATVEHGELRVDAGTVSAGGREWRDAAVRFDGGGAVRVTLEGVQRRYAAHVTAEEIWIARDGYQVALRTANRRGGDEGELVDSLQAPLPGKVIAVNVADGDRVEKDQVLVVLESMKMELSITAPHPGTVSGLRLRPGDRVAVRQPLLAVHEEQLG
jgi:acetyl-CoA/propionyl-CoA carboxylase biotin carboxyl carrier protein